MLISLGTMKKRKIVTDLTGSDFCMNCGHTVKHVVERERVYLSFFLIPTLPLHTRYSVKCPACTFSRTINKTEVKDFSNETDVTESGLAYSES